MSKTIRYTFSERTGSNRGERWAPRAIVKEESRQNRRANDKEAVKEGFSVSEENPDNEDK